MTKKQIETGCKKAVADNADLQICNAVEWLLDYELIDWKTRSAIYDAISRARASEEQSA